VACKQTPPRQEDLRLYSPITAWFRNSASKRKEGGQLSKQWLELNLDTAGMLMRKAFKWQEPVSVL